jgi:hypothetical protein
MYRFRSIWTPLCTCSCVEIEPATNADSLEWPRPLEDSRDTQSSNDEDLSDMRVCEIKACLSARREHLLLRLRHVNSSSLLVSYPFLPTFYAYSILLHRAHSLPSITHFHFLRPITTSIPRHPSSLVSYSLPTSASLCNNHCFLQQEYQQRFLPLPPTCRFSSTRNLRLARKIDDFSIVF